VDKELFMLNEDRVKVMTKLAIFESKIGKKDLEIGKYYRSDYIGYNMLKTAAAITVAYFIMASLWICCHMNVIMEYMNQLNFMKLIRQFLLPYIILVVVYSAIAYVYYSYKYAKAMKRLRGYSKDLKKLKYIFSIEEKKAKSKMKSMVGGEQDDEIAGN
jgi:urea transporter